MENCDKSTRRVALRGKYRNEMNVMERQRKVCGESWLRLELCDSYFQSGMIHCTLLIYVSALGFMSQTRLWVWLVFRFFCSIHPVLIQHLNSSCINSNFKN